MNVTRSGWSNKMWMYSIRGSTNEGHSFHTVLVHVCLFSWWSCLWADNAMWPGGLCALQLNSWGFNITFLLCVCRTWWGTLLACSTAWWLTWGTGWRKCIRTLWVVASDYSRDLWFVLFLVGFLRAWCYMKCTCSEWYGSEVVSTEAS